MSLLVDDDENHPFRFERDTFIDGETSSKNVHWMRSRSWMNKLNKGEVVDRVMSMSRGRVNNLDKLGILTDSWNLPYSLQTLRQMERDHTINTPRDDAEHVTGIPIFWRCWTKLVTTDCPYVQPLTSVQVYKDFVVGVMPDQSEHSPFRSRHHANAPMCESWHRRKEFLSFIYEAFQREVYVNPRNVNIFRSLEDGKCSGVFVKMEPDVFFNRTFWDEDDESVMLTILRRASFVLNESFVREYASSMDHYSFPPVSLDGEMKIAMDKALVSRGEYTLEDFCRVFNVC